MRCNMNDDKLKSQVPEWDERILLSKMEHNFRLRYNRTYSPTNVIIEKLIQLIRIS